MGLLDQAQDSAAARAQQDIRATATAPSAIAKKAPDFQEILRKLDKLQNMADELDRRTASVNERLFGPVPEKGDSDENKKWNGDSFVGIVMFRMDNIFASLDSLQQHLNKLHIELGNENQ